MQEFRKRYVEFYYLSLLEMLNYFGRNIYSEQLYEGKNGSIAVN